MDISKKLINDLAPKSKLVGAFFNEDWWNDNAIDIARARELTRQARNHELQAELNEANETAGDDPESTENLPGH